MRTLLRISLALTFAALLAATAAAQGTLHRLAADTKNFDSTESSTVATVAVDGESVYSRTVFVPGAVNALYVTISATGDTHDGAALWLSCRLNGAFCNPGGGGAAGAPGGWVSLQKHKNHVGPNGQLQGDGGGGGGDQHDNSITYTWCTRVQQGLNTVEIRMATSGPDWETGTGTVPPRVFFEAAHFYIDASRTAAACAPVQSTEG